VEQLQAYPNAFAVEKDSASGRFNQLKGDTLIADFDSGAISHIKLYPNSSILYHTTNDAGEADGAVESSSPETRLFFENGELVRAKMGKNQGLFLPEHAELPERRLEGYSWNPDLKPVRPTLIPQPRFTKITEAPPFSLPVKYVDYLRKRMVNQ
jgi:hypothetical protein